MADHAYFVPDDAILSALISAAMRGVDVRVIVPARGDSRLIGFAARSYFPEMVAAGARMFEYQPAFVHAKAFVVDDDIAIVGTANLDNRSFRLRARHGRRSAARATRRRGCSW